MINSLHELSAIRRDSSLLPRVHGNGFIQLDLPGGDRAHFWGHPDIPRQVTRSQLHDHTFGFRSHVLRGRMINIVYAMSDDEYTHEICVVVPRIGQDTILMPTGDLVGPIVIGVGVIRAGGGYDMPPAVFHETVVDEPTVTVIHKTDRIEKRQARVLVPIGHSPDNEFERSQAADPDTLWGIIQEMIN